LHVLSVPLVEDQIAGIDGLIMSPAVLNGIGLVVLHVLQVLIEILLPVEVQGGFVDAEEVGVLLVYRHLRNDHVVQAGLTLNILLVESIFLTW
jgi:hypothetical protein